MSAFRMDTDGFLRWLTGRLDNATENAAEDIRDDAQRLAPKDTGQLARSIHAVGKRVVVEADYWTYVEYGTSDTPAQPFMRPALYRSRNIRVRGA